MKKKYWLGIACVGIFGMTIRTHFDFVSVELNQLLWWSFSLATITGLAHLLLTNRVWLGISSLLVGGFCNFLAIAVNGWRMPTSSYEYVVGAGIPLPRYTSIINANLPWLGDWILDAISPGDIIVLVGTIIFLILVWKQGAIHRIAKYVEQS